MKYTQMTKRVLACGMALAMATTSTGFYPSLTVNAKKKSSKAKAGKAKLNKKKATLTEGSTITLKVKSANKKVKWSSKNKKIASVAKVSGKKKDTATIKGMKKGKTTIVAKVGKKKLTCKVTIQKSNLKAVAVDTLDSSALIVTFAKKTALNAADVKIAVKDYKEGTYNVQPKVEAISTKDQKTYYLYLTSEIQNGDYVKVSHGKYVREIQHKEKLYTEKEKYTIIYEKDSTVNEKLFVKDSIENKYVKNAIGNVSFSLKKKNKLPKGMVLAGKKALLKGIPTEAGSTEFTLVATDEAGRSIDVNYVFKTYDENTLAVEDLFDEDDIALNDYMVDVNTVVQPLVATTAGVIGDRNTYVKTVTVAPKGGSGRYKFTLTASDPNVRLSTDKLNATTNAVEQEPSASTTIYIPYGLAEGEHSYTLNIQDAADGNRATTTTVNFAVDAYYNVSGTVTDAQGTALQGNELVYFIPKDAKSMAETIGKQTYMKEQYTAADRIWKVVGGNYRETEGALVESELYTFVDGSKVEYEEYMAGYSAKVGPLPLPTVLVDSPVAAPVTAAPTADASAATAAPSVPTATPYAVPNLDAGKYQAELPKGDYVVKVRGNNGVLYQLDGAVSVAADAVDTTNLQMPVHFANATGVAKFANGKTLPGGERIYFETSNKQYENFVFSAKTDYTGKFSVSLPVGTYNAYWLDENEKAQYFATPITINDNTNVELGEISLSINRSVVSGVFYAGPAGTDGKRPALGHETLYFYDAKGKCYTVRTDGEYKYVNGVKTNCTEGAYSIVLPDGAYTVRYKSKIEKVEPTATPGVTPSATPDTVPTATPNSSERSTESVGGDAAVVTAAPATTAPNYGWDDDYNYGNSGSTSTEYAMYTLATVNVAGADVAQDLEYETSKSRDLLFSKATQITLGADNTMVSTGNNDMIAKFEVPAVAAPDTDKKYEFDITYTMNNDNYRMGTVKVIGADGSVYDTTTINQTDISKDYGYNECKYITTQVLTAGSYYVVFTPYVESTKAQAVGMMTAKVGAYVPVSFTTPQNLVSGASIEVTCTKNSTDPRMKGYGYFTMDIAEGQRYVDLTLTTATIGANTHSISYSLDGLSWSSYDEGESLPVGKVYFRIYCGDVLSAKYTVTAK